jgi:hypothetical protein
MDVSELPSDRTAVSALELIDEWRRRQRIEAVARRVELRNGWKRRQRKRIEPTPQKASITVGLNKSRFAR